MADKTENTPIVINDLHKAFGDQTVLDGINLQVGSGETVAVLGRSGGGKSVLLKLIMRLQTPVECPANLVPVDVRQTGMRGA